MSVEQANDLWTPSSAADRAAVHEQLERLLAAPLFHASKRYPSFLRFVITNALAGHTDLLKERLLGIEVFGRAPDYDTTIDPIVRVTAAEIRKRIEQYYQEPEHAAEIRLFLPCGSYIPQFYPPGHHVVASKPKPQTAHTPPEMDRSEAPSKSEAPSRWKTVGFPMRKLIISISAVAIAVAFTIVWYALHPPVMKQFWEPFVRSREPVLFCLADQIQYSSIRLRDSADPQRETSLPDSLVAVKVDDVSPLINIAGTLHTYGKAYRVLGESNTTLADLRRGPSILIGAFDNVWTLRLTSPLRFHFANDASMMRKWIEDRANPGKSEWVLEPSHLRAEVYKDYAIVTRFLDPNTDEFVVVAAGIGTGGTVAAGEFLVNESYMDEMLSQLPSNWRRKNIEIVLETKVIQRHSGPPHVSAVHVW